MNIYFVYLYTHPITSTPFYVGYGKNNRHLDHLKVARRYPTPTSGAHKLNTIRKILKAGLLPKIEFIDTSLSREQACELEIFLINEIGRRDLGTGSLTNKTSGGDGNRGWDNVARKQMSERYKDHIAVKDPETGKKFKIHKCDPRWLSRSVVGQNLGEVNTNKNGKLNQYIIAKHIITGECFRVKPTDIRWIRGELVGINKGVPAHPNTIAAAKAKKGIPKSIEHNKKNSDAVKQLKWYCNFTTGVVGRFKEHQQPDSFVRVSGPHKRIPV